ncbi:FAD-binding oxidoreductase [Leptospira kanakyensis]|uniref:FAD-binding oxidoreductase n=1 Tax=Leptospira kanakyensis TaxID=2484968 RepID=A0A6N4PUR0_9LEPT|nr:FAD-binding oxidoreductase [Leptospira kanakyensis]MCW7469687.1 FAD-binding oxidoreductase [Leptospira kanakyensis]MCW7480667.1 FAD-binding oxidoreductase [Leptospira kanakyensis]TGK47439.1 FAD-binding oxidoreductase [Leptospira kanakyensis]TGK63558.1 FAD-binding oxidoreductase [Leptospira kanakyensis]TGK67161.1 FAD-binding oxidoreductase [Leptospira kanakyensis]
MVAKKTKSISEIKIPKKEKVEAWGMSSFSLSPIFRPESEEEIKELFVWANQTGTKVALRGGGCSYGDASTNTDGIVLDLTHFNKVLDFNLKTGVMTVQSGARIKDLWETGIENGFWPPVVSGTMMPTLGGALSMNIHGKNNFKVGTIGEHIKEFTFLTAKGDILVCSPKKNTDLFYSAISGFGMLGCFLTVQIKMKPIYAGKMKIDPVYVRNFDELFAYFEEHYKTSDYLVGWIDAFASGKSMGRGQIHKATNLKEGEDPDFPGNCLLERQHLPSRLFYVIPKKWMWILMRPFSFNLGMRLINLAKCIASILVNNKAYYQGHAEYAFLLDYVPNWKFVYKPGAMIQYQVFIPKENAKQAFREIFTICQERGIVNYLSVFKKHKPDPFLLTHAVDGFSMAMDFPVTKGNREKLWALCKEMDEIVLKHKGRFYFAKDSTLRKRVMESYFPKDNLKRFYSLKKKYDPKGILQTDLYKRVFLTEN